MTPLIPHYPCHAADMVSLNADDCPNKGVINELPLDELVRIMNQREWPHKRNCHFYLEDKTKEWFTYVTALASARGRKRIVSGSSK